MVQGKRYQLVAFDVDGTLVASGKGQVVWEIFNEHFCGDRASNAMRGLAFEERHITYAEWVGLDVSDWMLAGATRAQMERLILERLVLTPGAAETVRRLRAHGLRLAVISGTLDLTLELLFPGHPFEVVYTNQLYFDAAGRVDDWRATHFDNAGKAQALRQIARQMAVPLERTVFVGDHLNDLEVMRAAGLAIAFEPKHPSVSAIADAEVHGDLGGVLRLLGIE
ncbi:MAG: HAD family phosphatase [Proteobacteria bacterium]|nr:HAD family phosphatase [Pseudomonadota bacterium]